MTRRLLILAVCLLLSGVTAAASAATPDRLWVDTDLACDTSAFHDVDDCLALAALALQSPSRIAGLSTTYGNLPLIGVDKVAEKLLPLLKSQTGVPLIAVSGARGRADCRSNAASRAILATSRQTRLTILALGPLTNLACALSIDPGLAQRVSRVVIVGGSVPGHVFHPAEGSTRALFGHGWIARDLNVELDPTAMRQVLRSGMPITLVPYQAARGVLVRQTDLSAMATAGPLGAYVASTSKSWMGTWRWLMGQSGFYPFDTLAVAAVFAPAALQCRPAWAQVTADAAISGNRFGPQRLLVGASASPSASQRPVTWCGGIAPGGARSIPDLLSASPK